MSVDKVIIKTGDTDAIPFFSEIVWASTWFIKKSRVSKSAYKKKQRAFIGFKNYFKPGDIIEITGYPGRIYLVKEEARGVEGFIYEFKRVDECRISQFDLDLLIKKKYAQVRGRFNNYKCNR